MAVTTSWQDLLRPGDATDFFSRATLPPFDPTAIGFHAGNALWLAELSRLVYRKDIEERDPPPQPTRAAFLASVGLRQRGFFQSRLTDTQALLVESDMPRFAVLAFRGTEQRPQDFVTDLRVLGKRLPDGGPRAHAGFEAALDSIWPAVDRELARVACPIYFTGHSLGAALATLAAARRAPWAAYTFGSPLVGNTAFAVSLAAVPVYRVVDDLDAVTTVPPEALGFRHVGELTRLKEGPAQSFAGIGGWLRRFFGPPKDLADHAPINYVDRVGAIVPAEEVVSV
jgi:hypothetical protein